MQGFEYGILPLLKQACGEQWPAAMLAINRSTGVTPEVNVRENTSYIHLYQIWLRLLTLDLKPRGDITRSPKQGYQWSHKRTGVHQKLFEKTYYKSHVAYLPSGTKLTLNFVVRSLTILSDLTMLVGHARVLHINYVTFTQDVTLWWELFLIS